jgi:hypothetical protein
MWSAKGASSSRRIGAAILASAAVAGRCADGGLALARSPGNARDGTYSEASASARQSEVFAGGGVVGAVVCAAHDGARGTPGCSEPAGSGSSEMAHRTASPTLHTTPVRTSLAPILPSATSTDPLDRAGTPRQPPAGERAGHGGASAARGRSRSRVGPGC